MRSLGYPPPVGFSTDVRPGRFDVRCRHVAGSTHARWMFNRFSLDLRQTFDQCSFDVPSTLTRGARDVHRYSICLRLMFARCSSQARRFLAARSSHVRRRFAELSIHRRRMHVACSSQARRFLDTSSSHARRMLVACPPNSRYIFVACSSHARRMLAEFSIHLRRIVVAFSSQYVR